MRASFVFLLVMCAVVAACSKRNPELCCVTTAECDRAGFDSPAPCAGSGVCVDNACQASGCDGDEDCARPLVCSAGQCAQPADWVARHGGDGMDGGESIAAAPDGDLVMTGFFHGAVSLGGDPVTAAGDTSPWVARYKPDGAMRWSVELGDAAAATGGRVQVDPSGDVYVAGLFVGPASYGSGTSTFSGGNFLVKLSGLDGSHQWDRVIAPDAVVTDMAVIDAGHIAVCGLLSATTDLGGGSLAPTLAGSNDFLAVYDTATGAYVWAKTLGAANRLGQSCLITIVGDDLVVTGGFQGTAMLGGAPLVASGSSDFFLARYKASDGSHMWSIEHGGTGQTLSLAIASDGDTIFVGGQLTNTANLGGANVTAAGAQDAFVAAYRAIDGTLTWATTAGGAGAQSATASLATSSGRLTAAIAFSLAPIAVGTQTLTPDDGDIAITKLNPSTGVPTATPSQFTQSTSDTNGTSNIAIALVYTFDRLAGVGMFEGGATLFGSRLLSVGDNDIASFRVDF